MSLSLTLGSCQSHHESFDSSDPAQSSLAVGLALDATLTLNICRTIILKYEYTRYYEYTHRHTSTERRTPTTTPVP